jgi:hypothetical protein
LDSENPITICSDEEEDDVIFGKDENLVLLDDSDEDDVDGDNESEDDETSDEDFKVDELNEASDDDDDDSYEHEEKKKTRMRTNFDVVEELERVVMDKESGISVNNEEVDYSGYGSRICCRNFTFFIHHLSLKLLYHIKICSHSRFLLLFMFITIIIVIVRNLIQFISFKIFVTCFIVFTLIITINIIFIRIIQKNKFSSLP